MGLGGQRHDLAALPLGKNRRLLGPRTSTRGVEKRKVSLPAGFEPRIVLSVAQITIPAKIPRILY